MWCRLSDQSRFVSAAATQREIETQSELTMDMTVADWWGVTDRAPNADFMNDLDRRGFSLRC